MDTVAMRCVGSFHQDFTDGGMRMNGLGQFVDGSLCVHDGGDLPQSYL